MGNRGSRARTLSALFATFRIPPLRFAALRACGHTEHDKNAERDGDEGFCQFLRFAARFPPARVHLYFQFSIFFRT